MTWRRRQALAAVAASLLLALAALAACGGGGGSGGEGADGANDPGAGASLPPVGPIPGAEFATVPPPTFQQAVTAFRTVTTANPALLNDEPALSRALFDEVRRLTVTGAAAEGRVQALGVVRRMALFDLQARMTLEEWKLVIRSPIASARAATTIEPSAQAAMARLPCDAGLGFSDGKADALRHAYWNALMVRRVGAAFAELFATAHEVGSNNTAAASAMDLHNNAAGRALAARFPNADDERLLDMLLQQRYTWLAAGAAVSGTTAGLVFIAEGSRQPFDGVYTGTLSHPGSGSAAWQVELRLTQCAAQVHGHYRATRGSEASERRFSGTLDGSTITLAVADPAADETAAGPNACLGLRIALSGSVTSLAGPWTATNCPQGGRLTLSR